MNTSENSGATRTSACTSSGATVLLPKMGVPQGLANIARSAHILGIHKADVGHVQNRRKPAQKCRCQRPVGHSRSGSGSWPKYQLFLPKRTASIQAARAPFSACRRQNIFFSFNTASFPIICKISNNSSPICHFLQAGIWNSPMFERMDAPKWRPVTDENH